MNTKNSNKQFKSMPEYAAYRVGRGPATQLLQGQRRVAPFNTCAITVLHNVPVKVQYQEETALISWLARFETSGNSGESRSKIHENGWHYICQFQRRTILHSSWFSTSLSSTDTCYPAHDFEMSARSRSMR